jgi:hypothetical protein
MQANPSSPAVADSAEENAYELFLGAMLDRAIQDMAQVMDCLGDAHHIQRQMLPPGGVSSIESLRSRIRGPWSDFVKQKESQDGLRWQLTLSNDPSNEERLLARHDRCDAKVERTLADIRDILKTIITGNPSQGAREILLAFDQVLLWRTLLYEPEADCNLLLIDRDPKTGTEFVTEFRFPTEKWDQEDLEMDSALFATRTLPEFSSMKDFSSFCEDSVIKTAAESVANLFNERYSRRIV